MVVLSHSPTFRLAVGALGPADWIIRIPTANSGLLPTKQPGTNETAVDSKRKKPVILVSYRFRHDKDGKGQKLPGILLGGAGFGILFVTVAIICIAFIRKRRNRTRQRNMETNFRRLHGIREDPVANIDTYIDVGLQNDNHTV